ncbi:patatin-like phospholipase [Nitzschia inconspicua]|uniref:Patatin-like phospholipase n=1 Tax=Nitzschia inconspicua TaxID=303405 RepID=A0A9K3LZC0_9STRA|nr:patatin-like phospholipase [Nitzschia inconspicua]
MKSEFAVLICFLTATLQVYAFGSEGQHINRFSAIQMYALSKPRSHRPSIHSEDPSSPHGSWLRKIRLRRRNGGTVSKNNFTSIRHNETKEMRQRKYTKVNGLVEIKTVAEFERYWYGDDPQNHIEIHGNKDKSSTKRNPRDYLDLLKRLSIVGDTQIIGSKDHLHVVHPVVKVLHKRRRALQQKPTAINDGSSSGIALNKDGNKVALVVEGGGMRGCISAGMVCALHHLGLEDTVDVVYGSSAGAVVAAYFCSRQVPWFGPEVYYDQLTTAGEKFIDLKRLLRSLGFGLADPRLFKDVLLRPENGKPLLNLEYLVGTTMQDAKPLDFKAFKVRQKVQPLKVVATALQSERAVVLSEEGGHFETLQDLCSSLHASCLLPGIAGPVMNVLKDPKKYKRESVQKPTFMLQNDFQSDHNEYEPLGDAILTSPIPYDLAIKDGATHVIAIRSSPDGHNLMAGSAAKCMWESLIFRRFFLRKNNFPGMFERLQHEYQHQRIYATSILELNQAAAVASFTEQEQDRMPHQILTIALEPGKGEVSHLETSREAIFEGVRQGFARAFDALVEDPLLRGQGYHVAKRYFPDEILDYIPEEIGAVLSETRHKKSGGSAFEHFIYSNKIHPKTWDDAGMNEVLLHQYNKEAATQFTDNSEMTSDPGEITPSLS